MLLDTRILRAIARLSRASKVATVPEIELRVAAEPEELRSALVRLARSSLVVRRVDEVRLTMFGLAVAVASGAAQAGAKARPKARVRVNPNTNAPSKTKKLRAA